MSFLKQEVKVLLRSGTTMNANELYITLVAVQGELHNTLVELFGMVCVEHKHAGSTNTKQAFSNVLQTCKYLENIKTLDHGFNKNKLYDTHEDGTFVLRDEINLKIIDSMLLFDVLKNVKGFPTYQKSLQRRQRMVSCKQALHQQCCLACNHKCMKCNRKVCKDDSCHVGEKCNQHPCRNCDESKEVCLHSSSVCCKKCGTCYYCGNKLNFDQDKKCSRLRLVQGIAVLKDFRILLEDLTFQDCKMFLDGSKPLPGFPLCRSLPELCDTILDSLKEVLEYLSKAENFKKQHALSTKLIQWKIGHVASIFKHKDVDILLYSQQDDIHKVLAFNNENRMEPSNEYTTIFKKIETLNKDEGFRTRKSVILIDDAESFEDTEENSNEALEVRGAEDGIDEATLQQPSDFETSDSSSDDEDNDEEEEEVHVVANEIENPKDQMNVTESLNLKEDITDKNNNTFGKLNHIHQRYHHNKNEQDEAGKIALKDVVDEILLCVNVIKENSKTYENNVLESIDAISREQAISKLTQDRANNQVSNKLSEITEKLINIETEMKLMKEEQKREIEEIKMNQKNLLDMIQSKQKGKKQGIIKTK